MAKKQLPIEVEIAIVADYNNEMSIKQIIEKYNTSQRLVYRALENQNVSRKAKRFSEKQYKNATNDYIKGMSMEELVEKHGISFVSICKYMRQNGIDYYSGHGRKHHFNQDYFQELNSPEKVYWFGYLYADGSINKVNTYDVVPVRLRLNCSKKDRYLIEKFLEALECDTEITDYIPKGTYAQNEMSKVAINSKKLCDDLTKNGFRLLKKDSTGDVFNHIDKKFHRDFIRGYFDGDGSITTSQMFFTVEESLGIKIQEILMQNCQLNKTSLRKYEDKGYDSLVTLTYGGRLQLIKIFNYLYEDAKIFLPRKHERFMEEIAPPVTKRTISSPQ